MLGFDALGRRGLGELGQLAFTNTVLLASAGSYSCTGSAATFSLNFLSPVAASYTETGSAATFTAKLNAVAGSYAETGSAATFAIGWLSPATGAYTVSGYAAMFDPSEICQVGTFTVNGNVSDNILVFNGVGAAYLFSGNASHWTQSFYNWVPATEISNIWAPLEAPENADLLPFSGGFDGILSARFALGQIGQPVATNNATGWTAVNVPSITWTPDNNMTIPPTISG